MYHVSSGFSSSYIAIFKHNFTICDIFMPLINLKGLWDLMNSVNCL